MVKGSVVNGYVVIELPSSPFSVKHIFSSFTILYVYLHLIQIFSLSFKQNSQYILLQLSVIASESIIILIYEVFPMY